MVKTQDVCLLGRGFDPRPGRLIDTFCVEPPPGVTPPRRKPWLVSVMQLLAGTQYVQRKTQFQLSVETLAAVALTAPGKGGAR